MNAIRLAMQMLWQKLIHRQPDAVQRISDLMGNVCRKAADGAQAILAAQLGFEFPARRRDPVHGLADTSEFAALCRQLKAEIGLEPRQACLDLRKTATQPDGRGQSCRDADKCRNDQPDKQYVAPLLAWIGDARNPLHRPGHMISMRDCLNHHQVTRAPEDLTAAACYSGLPYGSF